MVKKLKHLIILCLIALSFPTVSINAIPTEKSQENCSEQKDDKHEEYENSYENCGKNNENEEILNYFNNIEAELSNNKNSEISNNNFSELSNNIGAIFSNNLGADIEEFLDNQHNDNNSNEIMQLEEESLNNNINNFNPQANIPTTNNSIENFEAPTSQYGSQENKETKMFTDEYL